MIPNWLIVYLGIGLLLSLYAIGYYRRDWNSERVNRQTIAATVLANFLLWPLVILIAFGEVVRDRAERTERMQRGNDVKIVFVPGSGYENTTLHNITEIHFGYYSSMPRKQVAFESDIHRTGCTYYVDEIAEFEAVTADMVAVAI